MKTKRRVILSIAAALASLAAAPSDQGNAAVSDEQASATVPERAQAVLGAKPNVVYAAGEELLGMVVTRQADGSVVAYHSSHVSHHSHHSHHSHYSSR